MIPIYAGLTSQSIDIFIPDSASAVGAGKTGLAYNTASLTAYYRKGAAGSPTAITLATLANAQAAYSSGGFVEIDATNQPGMYRLDLPNAAVDTAGLVHVMLKGATGMAPVPVRIDCRALPADMKQIGGDTQSATDIKDFADTGYDPATHKVQGVVLTDTLTNYTGNTPQTGDSFARLGAPAGASVVADIATRASAAQISALQVNTRTNLQVPIEIETPDVGTQVWKIRLHLYDIEGNMEAPDGTPTVTLTNAAGTDRSSRLSAASNPSVGVYTWDYTSTAADAEEQLIWLFTVIEGALTRTYPATSYVVEETAYRFSSTDRATLAGVKLKTDFLPSANAGSAGGLFIAGSNAATTVATWTVSGATAYTGVVSMAAGLEISQSAANQEGLQITGNGNAPAVLISSAAGAAAGMQIVGGTNSDGIIVQGNGSGGGVHIEGGATGIGLHVLGGTTSGSAMAVIAQGTNDHALELVSIGTGNGIRVDTITVTGAFTVTTNAIAWNAAWDAEVQSEVQDAIEVNHLDHLFAVDYNPASKPGVATALFNELIESDAGVSRFTANALEMAPSGGGGGGGGDATLANQTLILADLATIINVGVSLAVASTTTGTISGFPTELVIKDSYLQTLDNDIQIFIRDGVTPLTGIGSKSFTDLDFAPELTISQGMGRDKVKATLTWVPAVGPTEGYLRCEFTSDMTRRASPGEATMQLVLAWTGVRTTRATQSVLWVENI